MPHVPNRNPIKIRHIFQIPNILYSYAVVYNLSYKFIIYRTNISFVQMNSIDRRLSDLFNIDSKEQSSETDICFCS